MNVHHYMYHVPNRCCSVSDILLTFGLGLVRLLNFFFRAIVSTIYLITYSVAKHFAKILSLLVGKSEYTT